MPAAEAGPLAPAWAGQGGIQAARGALLHVTFMAPIKPPSAPRPRALPEGAGRTRRAARGTQVSGPPGGQADGQGQGQGQGQSHTHRARPRCSAPRQHRQNFAPNADAPPPAGRAAARLGVGLAKPRPELRWRPRGEGDVTSRRKRKYFLPARKLEAVPRPGAHRACRRGYGEPDGEGRAQHPRHQPAVPGGKDHPHAHLRVQVLEGGMLRPHRYGPPGQRALPARPRGAGPRALGVGLGAEAVTGAWGGCRGGA